MADSAVRLRAFVVRVGDGAVDVDIAAASGVVAVEAETAVVIAVVVCQCLSRHMWPGKSWTTAHRMTQAPTCDRTTLQTRAL